MYFPVLRGRQFELIALRELIENKLIGKHVLPIVEPVKLTATLNTTLSAFREANSEIAVIRNPRVGEFVSKLRNPDNEKVTEKFYAEIEKGSFISTYYIDNKDRLDASHITQKGLSLDQCIAICLNKDSLSKYKNIFGTTFPKYTLIPDERSMRRSISTHKVLLDDKFDKKARNTDYAIEEDTPFSEDHLFYDDEGYVGFADYSIVGAEYNESGFAPYAVVIHIVYPDEDGALRIHHFVSDSNDDISDPAGKFEEALQKFHHWNQMHKLDTFGANEFEKLYNNQYYPGLGTVKKLSIMHHIELVSRYLDGVKQ